MDPGLIGVNLDVLQQRINRRATAGTSKALKTCVSREIASIEGIRQNLKRSRGAWSAG
jgi:hypothetical protein